MFRKAAISGLIALVAMAFGPGAAGAEAPPLVPIPCEGDACQPLPPEPEDPTPGTLVPNPGNPVQPAAKKKGHKPKKKHTKHRGKGRRK